MGNARISAVSKLALLFGVFGAITSEIELLVPFLLLIAASGVYVANDLAWGVVLTADRMLIGGLQKKAHAKDSL